MSGRRSSGFRSDFLLSGRGRRGRERAIWKWGLLKGRMGTFISGEIARGRRKKRNLLAFSFAKRLTVTCGHIKRQVGEFSTFDFALSWEALVVQRDQLIFFLGVAALFVEDSLTPAFGFAQLSS